MLKTWFIYFSIYTNAECFKYDVCITISIVYICTAVMCASVARQTNETEQQQKELMIFHLSP